MKVFVYSVNSVNKGAYATIDAMCKANDLTYSSMCWRMREANQAAYVNEKGEFVRVDRFEVVRGAPRGINIQTGKVQTKR